MQNEGQRNAPIRETKSIKKGGMILPFQPLSLVFDDIRYAVDVPQVHKKVFLCIFAYNFWNYPLFSFHGEITKLASDLSM